MGQARLAEMHLIVDHAGQQVMTCGVDHPIAWLSHYLLAYLSDEAILDANVSVLGLPLIDEQGIKDTVGSHLNSF